MTLRTNSSQDSLLNNEAFIDGLTITVVPPVPPKGVQTVSAQFFVPRSTGSLVPRTPDPSVMGKSSKNPEDYSTQELLSLAQIAKNKEQQRYLHTLARAVGQGCVEAELGLRPVRQLAAWLDLQTYEKMHHRILIVQRRQQNISPTRVRAVSSRIFNVGDDTYEASTSIHVADRLRAVALRLEKRRNRWKVTALEVG